MIPDRDARCHHAQRERGADGLAALHLEAEQGDEAEIGGMIEMLNVIGGSFFLRDTRSEELGLFLFRKMEIEES